MGLGVEGGQGRVKCMTDSQRRVRRERGGGGRERGGQIDRDPMVYPEKERGGGADRQRFHGLPRERERGGGTDKQGSYGPPRERWRDRERERERERR